MPFSTNASRRCLFSSANLSLSRETLLKISLSLRTSSSRALMYSSFLSRCVLVSGHEIGRCNRERTVKHTSELVDSAPGALSKLACCWAWDHASLADFPHGSSSCQQGSEGCLDRDPRSRPCLPHPKSGLQSRRPRGLETLTRTWSAVKRRGCVTQRKTWLASVRGRSTSWKIG